MDFYLEVGRVAMGSRLRRLSEMLTANAGEVCRAYGVDLDPKWFPVFHLLSLKGEASITEIARDIGHSHPSVSQIVSEMKARGLAVTARSDADARVNVVRLSEAGKALLPNLERQCGDVREAVDALLAQSRHNLWDAIEETERLLRERSLPERVGDVRRVRESDAVEIIDHGPALREAFKRLNVEWIESLWELEDEDLKSLDHPEAHVLEPGGFILYARYRGEIVGTCALLKVDDETFELAKMAVTANARGKGIGERLARAGIERARDAGARTVYLESNTVLEPAISLYRKLGFEEIPAKSSPYARCNIQMALALRR